MSTVTVDLRFDMGSGVATFTDATTVRPEALAEVVEAFLRCQIGAGQDKTPPDTRDVYSIRIDLDLRDDSFRVQHDCGNKGLRDGILMAVLKQLVAG